MRTKYNIFIGLHGREDRKALLCFRRTRKTEKEAPNRKTCSATTNCIGNIVKCDCDQWTHCNICTAVKMSTTGSEHVITRDVPMCKGQCVLRRLWSRIRVGSCVTEVVCAVDGLHGRGHWGQRWRKLTARRLLKVTESCSLVIVSQTSNKIYFLIFDQSLWFKWWLEARNKSKSTYKILFDCL